MNLADTISKRWCEEGRKYVAGINEYVRQGMTVGWEYVDEPPEDTRSDLAEKVIAFVRQANQTGRIEGLRQKFPPAHAPFLKILEKNRQHLGPIILLDDNRILLRVGAPYQAGTVYIINGLNVEPIKDIISFGQSSNKKYFALAKQARIEIFEGWNGRHIVNLNWPTGLEGVPDGYKIEPLKGVPFITQLKPFPDGRRALLVSPKGIFILAADSAVRLHPDAEDFREHIEWLQKEYPDDPLNLDLDMEHGAISPDGKFIAVGSQDSNHLIFNDNYELVGDVGPISSYPHHAVFSEDGKLLACNSCHFYNGITIGVPLTLLPSLKIEPYEMDSRLVELEADARVYAAVSRQDEFIFGDAYGYLRAVDMSGNFRWQHFIGSTICDIDISPDGKTLIVSTYAGFLSIIKLDTGTVTPYTIGTATHQEVRRWLFWQKESQPLAW